MLKSAHDIPVVKGCGKGKERNDLLREGRY